MKNVKYNPVVTIEKVEIHKAGALARFGVERNCLPRLLHGANVENLRLAKADPQRVPFGNIDTANHRPARVPNCHASSREARDRGSFEPHLEVQASDLLFGASDDTH